VNDRFVKNTGCSPTLLRERGDLPAPRGSRGFELSGCGHHDFYPWCETPGCSSDFSTVARDAFSRSAACPANRASAAPTRSLAASAPPEIASDGARLAIWTRERDEHMKRQEDQGYSLITVKGCDVEMVFSSWKNLPGLPVCGSIKL
jgi:hypothetical protein